MWIPSIHLAARATPITPTNKSTAITIATWTLMITTVMMFLSREVIKFAVLRKLGLDDILILFATILAIGLFATTLILASEGLGVLEQLTIAHADTLMKAYYASDFLYISSLCFAKLSLTAYFYNIFVQRTQRRVLRGLGVFVTVWTTASLGAIAFQCRLPKPWAIMSLSCYNTGVFWIVYCSIDMTTDVAIIMLSVNLVAYLKVKFSRKVTVVACFLPRVFVIGSSITRLIYLYPITPHDNPEFNLWIPVICSGVQVCLAISTACIPYIKPFFEGVEAGAWRADDLRKKGVSTTDIYAFGSKSAYTPAYKKGHGFHSIDSTVSMGLKTGRTTDESPRIPTPAPLSPLTPPRYNTPASSGANSKASSKRDPRAPSERGLKLHIPDAHRRPATVPDGVSPQTASSHALSPRYLSPISPQPLLSAHKLSPNREPTTPLRTHGPRVPVSSSYYGNNDSAKSSLDLNLRSPPRSPNFSLFPSPATGRYRLPPNRKPLVQKRFSNQRLSTKSPQHTQQPKYPPRTSSTRRWSGRAGPAIKFAVAPNPALASPTTTVSSSNYFRSTPTQSASTAPTIPSYYLSTRSTMSPSSFPGPQPPSPQHERNMRILLPSNSSCKDQIIPMSPAIPLTFWKEETSLESADVVTAETPMRANIPWDIEDIPIVQDARGSPRIIVRRSS